MQIEGSEKKEKRDQNESYRRRDSHWSSLYLCAIQLCCIRTIIVFSLFTLVKFDNGICGGLNGENGTCVAAAECAQRGGVSSGVCANGYGVCCIGKQTFVASDTCLV